MPDDENFQTEASKEDPAGFQKLEALTKGLLTVAKADMEAARRKDSGSPKQGVSDIQKPS